ncbi:predicted kinase, dihydroxyacetone kinase [Sanguibacter keddieii DSM 10542]|uniref:Predicted kinase, dihydroxyacetone kinase n=1 Tax=Sanguibacter keddieii (strain ATCC 51767 / DSM 10542 / NCFB 3025 / ST-74) TaxID=446469 RepID=D1BDK3_SANKS|nr:DAK2 domain-containing protein [Sanguibacter keddieii]ACZ21065.1 predicted kinase, dihydroxyacetone kinase [Sanguibacter keddieii DSM 10542]
MTHTSSTDGRSALLDVASVLRWAGDAVDVLERARPVIDRANVFPVPDADTGTNLAGTLTQARDSAVAAAGAGPATTDDVLHALAHGALLGARGSSGVIMSEFLRGFAAGHAASPAGLPDASRAEESAAGLLARALDRGAESAHASVVDPRSGTMLTAARGAADAAARAVTDGGGLAEVLVAACAGADAALRRSVDELDELRRARVLDAGAYGFVLVLDALCRALGHGPTRATEAETLSVAGEPVAHEGGSHAHGSHGAHGTVVDGEFEVMCVVRHAVGAEGGTTTSLEEVAPLLRSGLQQLGDSVVVVGGADRRDPAGDGSARRGTWQVHVHTDHPVDVLRLLDRWEVGQVVVRCLAHQVSARGAAELGLVACTSAPGLVTDLARSGAVVVLRGSGPVEREDLLRAVHETDAEQVLVLPADESTLALARGLGDLSRPQVTAVASTSDLHVVAALSAWVSDTSAGSAGRAARTASLRAMEAVVASVRAVQVDAARPAELVDQLSRLLQYAARTCEPSPTASTASTAPAAPTVLTVLAGDLVPASVLTDLVVHAERLAPGLETVVLPSGRRSTALVIGAEQQ